MKARGNPRLLAAATAEILEQPDLNADDAVDLAEQRHQDANAARAARLTRCDDSGDVDIDKVDEEVNAIPEEEPRVAVSAEVVTAALTALRSLLAGLRGGAQQLTGYDAGSLRLCVDELASLLPSTGATVGLGRERIRILKGTALTLAITGRPRPGEANSGPSSRTTLSSRTVGPSAL